MTALGRHLSRKCTQRSLVPKVPPLGGPTDLKRCVSMRNVFLQKQLHFRNASLKSYSVKVKNREIFTSAKSYRKFLKSNFWSQTTLHLKMFILYKVTFLQKQRHFGNASLKGYSQSKLKHCEIFYKSEIAKKLYEKTQNRN